MSRRVFAQCMFFMIAGMLALALPSGARGAEGGAAMAEPALYQIPEGIETRWASAENWLGEKGKGGEERGGRKGSPSFEMKAGAQKTLAEVKDQSGTVRRIWITINDRSPEMLRGLKLEMYWDGAAEPAVAAPIGDFFCQGLGRMAAFENALFASPEARSFNCTIPMPFRKGMKIVATNESGKDLRLFFYDVDYTIGDRHGEETAYFHAHWRRERPTTMQKDFEILPKVNGRGRYLGAVVSVIPNTAKYGKTWWGEGEVKAYLDGDDKLPTLAGTGTEDYIGTGWGQGQYALQYVGCPVADKNQFRYAFYRLHIPDPVWFHKECRVTIQQIGYVSGGNAKQFQKEGAEPLYFQEKNGMTAAPKEKIGTPGYNLFERQDDWAACAWFYLDTPTNGLPPLAPAAERMAGLLAAEGEKKPKGPGE